MVATFTATCVMDQTEVMPAKWDSSPCESNTCGEIVGYAEGQPVNIHTEEGKFGTLYPYFAPS